MTNDSEVVKEVSESIGQKLQATREAKKMTVTEVSSQLRLPKEMIESLESCEWDKLHSRIYARGYFASYVKFLGLAEEEMMTAFNNEYSSVTEEPSVLVTSMSTKQYFAWGKLVFVIGLSFILWFAYQQYLNNQTLEQAEQPVSDATISSDRNIEAMKSEAVNYE